MELGILLLLFLAGFLVGLACGAAIVNRALAIPGWRGQPRYIPPEIRKWVAAVSKYACIYCGRVGNSERDPDGSRWEIDHIIPLSQGGPHAVSNFALSCKACNRRKSAGLPPLPFTRERNEVRT